MSGVFAIPWDELSGADRSALMWAGAALLAAFPAAVGAVFWVAAWRGSPRFGAPRCRGCRAALRGSELNLPERCPECGKDVLVGGEPAIDYAMRTWRFGSFASRFAGGALSVLLAIAVGWLGGAIVARIDREARATGQVGAVGATLVNGTSSRMVLDALRFAADAAMSDDAIALEADAALRSFDAGEIDVGRGLALLLDRHDSDDGRKLLVDVLGSLASKGLMDEPRLRSLMERVTGAPSVVDEGGVMRFLPGSPDLSFAVERMTLNNEALAFRTEPVPSGLTLVPTKPLPSGARVTVDWWVRWAPALLSGDPGAAPPVDAQPRFTLRGTSVVTIAALPEGKPPPLFLARGIRPRVEVRSLGSATLVSGRLQAAVHPRRNIDGTWWLEVGSERVAIKARLGPEALELSIDGVLSRPINELPERFAILFEPSRGGEGLRLEGVRWRRGPAP